MYLNLKIMLLKNGTSRLVWHIFHKPLTCKIIIINKIYHKLKKITNVLDRKTKDIL